MKTIKIIDLLNKMANGEEVPKKIKYRDWLYDWNENAKDYECGNDWLEERICDDFKTFLNDKVEIIEEDKKIEKIKNNCEYDENLTYEEVRRHIIHNINFLKDKINELIDKVNSLENNK